MMGCDGACAAGFDLVFIGLPLLSLYEIPMLIWLSLIHISEPTRPP